MFDCLGPQTELQLLQTALIETKCQILQRLAGAMDKPASKQLEVHIAHRTLSVHMTPRTLGTMELQTWLCGSLSAPDETVCVA